MADLFSTTPSAPLAELLRPTTVEDIVGQQHLLGQGKPLRMAFQAGKPHSFILWGPPGVGKTTIAQLAGAAMGCEFLAVPAVSAGVKEIREAIKRAQALLDLRGRTCLLFMDEIHRLNKSQQDELLPHVESGLVVLVGATTENPSFALNPALLSRAHVYVLKAHTPEDLVRLFRKAEPHLRGIRFEPEAVMLLARAADGDARRFLNLLDQLSVAAQGEGVAKVSPPFVEASLGQVLRRFDRDGDGYDQISAFQKSIRGSSPDAALYWLARLLDAGEDPLYIARRLIVIASEDVGNADPRAIGLAIDAMDAFQRLGSPEGDRALAHATVYLAMAPKSNAVYSAWNAARAFVRANRSHEVPLHLRNAPTELMKNLGYHKGYRYAHDEPNSYAAGEHYFPDEVPAQAWYQPTRNGMELKIGEKLEWLRQLDAASNKKHRPE